MSSKRKGRFSPAEFMSKAQESLRRCDLAVKTMLSGTSADARLQSWENFLYHFHSCHNALLRLGRDLGKDLCDQGIRYARLAFNNDKHHVYYSNDVCGPSTSIGGVSFVSGGTMVDCVFVTDTPIGPLKAKVDKLLVETVDGVQNVHYVGGAYLRRNPAKLLLVDFEDESGNLISVPEMYLAPCLEPLPESEIPDALAKYCLSWLRKALQEITDAPSDNSERA